jgi:hypothetical protein
MLFSRNWGKINAKKFYGCFLFFFCGTGVAWNDIYRVRLSKNLKKIYEILKTPGGEKIVFIDFRYDKEAILAIVEGFKDRLSEGLDLIVS